LRRRARHKSAIIPSLRPLRFLLLWGLALALSPVLAQTPGEVRGSVVDAHGGETLANVVVQLVGGAYRVTSDNTGHFRIPAVAPGDYVLNVSTVGYHLVTRPFHLDALTEWVPLASWRSWCSCCVPSCVPLVPAFACFYTR
jgi:hypothetical protein